MEENIKDFQSIVGPITLPLNIDEIVDYHQLYYFEHNNERWACVLFGDISADEFIPLRIESACFFGHVFHSRQCDCGFQLMEAFSRIRKEKLGVVIYGIDQDARGLGIKSHFRIYDLRQNHNLDTEEVFQELGANIDKRSYEAVSKILRFLGIQKIKLLSNNPRRIKFLEENGFTIEREELEAPLDRFNMATLMLEKEDLGYKWTFKTHLDWLQPLQEKVDGTQDLYGGRIVINNDELAAEWVGNQWDVADNIHKQLEDKDIRDKKPVIYLTDFPRLDEIKKYAKIGASFIVVPFSELPSHLVAEAKKYEIKLQDWERNNKYTKPRQQWELTETQDQSHIYTRGNEKIEIIIQNEQ